MNDKVYFTTPIGRLVGGSVAQGNLVTDDKTGQPKLNKLNEQMVNFYVGVAIPKQGEQHWAQTEWGAKIYAAGIAAFPGGQAQQPTFAWKITDGDSTVPNQKGVIPSQKVGYPGCWVINFSTSLQQPEAWDANGSQRIQPAEIYKGCFVQVSGSVAGNLSTQSPGVYLNPDMVALAGHGERIATGPDVSQANFGQNVQAPQGMSAQPLAQNFAANVPGAQAGQPVQPQQPVQQGYVPPQQGYVPPQQGAPVQQQVVTGQPVQGGQPQYPPVQNAGPSAQHGVQVPVNAQQNAAYPTEGYQQILTPPQ